jgi:hypothetical protein
LVAAPLNGNPLGRTFNAPSLPTLWYDHVSRLHEQEHIAMSWWKRQRPSAPPASDVVSPARVELIPGQLAVRMYQPDLATQHGAIACWTYITEGLQRLHQPEVSLTLLRQSNTPPPQEPLHFFSMLHQLALQGRIVQAGGWTQFGTRKFFDRHLAYIPAQSIATIPMAPDTIMAISVTDDELIAVQAFGILRVMARLGQQARYYPCPPWLDPSRPGLAFAQTRQESLLARLPCFHSPQMRILRVHDHLVLRLAPTIRSQLADQLDQSAENVPIAFLTDLDAEADGCLVWEPGQTEPNAITPPDSQGVHIGGCFVACVPAQETTGGQLVEDGFVVFFTTGEWHAVRRALHDGQPVQVAATDGRLPLRVEWDRR